jgi:hypothetical protein
MGMTWSDIIERAMKHPALLVAGVAVSGAAGFAGGVSWLETKIENRIKESDYLRIQLKTLETRAAAPGPAGPQGVAGPKGDQGPSTNIPPGAVLAFDIREGCPNGWNAFKSAERRLVVGAATKPSESPGNFAANPPTYSDYPPGNAAGHGTAERKPVDEKRLTGTEYGFQPSDLYIPPTPEEQLYSFGSIIHGYPSMVTLHYCKKLTD